jgi:hypothetical protein
MIVYVQPGVGASAQRDSSNEPVLAQPRNPVLQRAQANPQHLGGAFAITAHVLEGEFDVSLLEIHE